MRIDQKIPVAEAGIAVGKQRSVAVLVAQRQFGRRHRPVDADLRVIPGDAPLGARAVRARGEVLDIDDVRQRAEAAREGPRRPQLQVVLVVGHDRLVAAQGRGAGTDVDSVVIAFETTSGEDSVRIPTSAALFVGTRSVILSFSNEITNSSSLMPAISCSSIETIWPTPWAG